MAGMAMTRSKLGTAAGESAVGGRRRLCAPGFSLSGTTGNTINLGTDGIE